MAKANKLDRTALSFEMAHPRLTASALKALKLLHENPHPQPKVVKGTIGK
jgi:hypothetical protein